MLTRVLLVLVALAVGVAAFVSTRWRGVQLIRDMAQIHPASDAMASHALPISSDGATHPRVRGIVVYPDGSIRSPQPVVQFVHGITDLGIADSRVHRAVEALRANGLAVVAPEVRSCVFPGVEAPSLSELVPSLAYLDPTADGPAADGGTLGVLGVSLGGALALRAVAHHIREGGTPPRAVLLVGTPWHLDAHLAQWLEPSDATMSKALRAKRRFARMLVVRAACATLVSDASLRSRLLAWLRTDDPRAAQPAIDAQARGTILLTEQAGDAAQRPDPTHAGGDNTASRTRDVASLIAFVRGDQDDDVWRAWIHRAASDRLQPADLNGRDDELKILADRGVPIFLVHGSADPLVHASEADAFRRALPHARVLVTPLVGHAEMTDAGLLDRWRLASFIDAWRDALDP